MRQIIKKDLPHGKIPFSSIRDLTMRDVIMKVNENILTLDKQIKAMQDAIIELQKEKR
jgi:hypothetical protein